MFGRRRRRGITRHAAPVAGGATLAHAAAPGATAIRDSDPRGTAMFLALAGVHQTGIDGTDGLVYLGDDGDPVRTWNGDLGKSLQQFGGAAALALWGASKPYTGIGTFETARAGDASRGDFDNVPLQIYAARAVRQGKMKQGLG